MVRQGTARTQGRNGKKGKQEQNIYLENQNRLPLIRISYQQHKHFAWFP
jgi:hypothetical protein